MSRKTFTTLSAIGATLTMALILGSRPLHAQAVSIATVTGHVADEQGAAMPGAQIKISAVDTGAVYNAVSNGEGIYTFPSLPIGGYTLQATVAGFQTYVQSGILLR